MGHQDGHVSALLHPQLQESIGCSVGSCIQLTVGNPLIAKDNGFFVWGFAGSVSQGLCNIHLSLRIDLQESIS
jgi:hypothetical protein